MRRAAPGGTDAAAERGGPTSRRRRRCGQPASSWPQPISGFGRSVRRLPVQAPPRRDSAQVRTSKRDPCRVSPAAPPSAPAAAEAKIVGDDSVSRAGAPDLERIGPFAARKPHSRHRAADIDRTGRHHPCLPRMFNTVTIVCSTPAPVDPPDGLLGSGLGLGCCPGALLDKINRAKKLFVCANQRRRRPLRGARLGVRSSGAEGLAPSRRTSL